MYLVAEAAGVEQGSEDVVGEVAEVQGGVAEVFGATVDGLRPVRRAGAVEVGENVTGTAPQGATKGDEIGRAHV